MSIVDTLPGTLSGATYTSVATGGASGFSASGSGSIDDTDVTLPGGSTITYTVHATIASAATGTLSNTATLTSSIGTTANASLVTGLGSPTSIAVSAGDVFVADSESGTISEYTTSGALVNASLVTGLSGPVYLAMSGGNLFIASANPSLTTIGSTIGEYNATTGAPINASLVTGLPVLSGIAISGGDLFVTSVNNSLPSATNGTIGEYNATTGDPINASLVTGLAAPSGISASGEDLFVTTINNSLPSATDGAIGEYNATTGAPVNASLVTGLDNPSAVAVSGGDLFVATPYGSIGEYTTAGATVNASFLTGLPDPVSIAVSGSDLFVAQEIPVITANIGIGFPASDYASTIGEYTTGDSTATDADSLTQGANLEITKTDNLGGSSISGATGTAVPGQSITYTVVVTNTGSATATGATVADPVPSSLLGATFTAVATGGATGFTAGGTGSIDDSGLDLPPGSTITYTVHAIIAPTATGPLSNTATVADVLAPTSNASLVTGMSDPQGIAVSGDDLFVTNTDVGTIGQYNATTGATINASLITGLSAPEGIAISGGDLFVTNFQNGTISEYTTSGALVNASLVTGIDTPESIVASGGDLFVTSFGTGTIGEYNATTGATINGSLATGSLGGEPLYIAVSGGDLFVSDEYAGTISEYTTSGNLVNASLVTGVYGTIAASGGYLFVAKDGIGGTDTSSIAEYTTTGTLIDPSLVAGLNSPLGIAASGQKLFVANPGDYTAGVGTVGEYDVVSNSATDSDTLTPLTGLEITKTDNLGGSSITGATGNAVPGQGITYTIVVSNAGPSSVTSASVVDTLPSMLSGATYKALATGGATGFTAGGAGSIDDTDVDMPAGSTITYTIQANIPPAATGTLSNKATVTDAAGAKSATDADVLTPEPELTIIKSDNLGGTSGIFGTGSAVPGTAITYTIVASNAGPSNATGASIVDTLPPSEFSDVTYTAVATGGASGFTARGTGSIDDTDVNMPAGSTVTYTLHATIGSLATGTLSNTATVSNVPGAPPVAQLVTGVGQAIGIAVAGGDMFVTNALTGTVGEYNAATGAPINASLITGLSQGGYPFGVAVSGGDLFVLNSSNGPDGSIGEYTTSGAVVNASLVAGLPINTTALAVSGGDIFVTGSSGTVEYTTSGVLVNSQLLPVGGSGILVSGNDLFITTGNSIGEYTKSGITVNASLVTGLDDPEGIAISGENLFVVNQGGDSGNMGNVAEYNATTGATINAALIGGLKGPNAIAISGGNLFVTGENIVGEYPAGGSSAAAVDSDTLTPEVDPQITKTDSVGGSSVTGASGTAAPGQAITFTIVASNNGPSGISGASVIDALPSSLVGATYTATATGGATGFTASGSGSIDDTNVTLPGGSTITYILHATVSGSATGTLSNTATLSSTPLVTVNASLVTGLSSPSGMAASGGDIFVENYAEGTVAEYTTSGALVNASLITDLSNPYAIAVSGGELFVRQGNGTVGVYNAASGAVINAALVTGLDDSGAIAVSGGDLFVQDAGTIGRYNAATGATINASLITGLNNPADITVSGGDLFVTEGGNSISLATIHVSSNFGLLQNPTGFVGEYNATTGADDQLVAGDRAIRPGRNCHLGRISVCHRIGPQSHRLSRARRTTLHRHWRFQHRDGDAGQCVIRFACEPRRHGGLGRRPVYRQPKRHDG